MTSKTEDEIVDDLLDYVNQHRSVCIKAKRQSRTEWIRKTDSGWLLVRENAQGNIVSRSLGEATVRVILKANYYQFIPADQARHDGQQASVWDELEGGQNHN